MAERIDKLEDRIKNLEQQIMAERKQTKEELDKLQSQLGTVFRPMVWGSNPFEPAFSEKDTVKDQLEELRNYLGLKRVHHPAQTVLKPREAGSGEKK